MARSPVPDLPKIWTRVIFLRVYNKYANCLQCYFFIDMRENSVKRYDYHSRWTPPAEKYMSAKETRKAAEVASFAS